MLQLSDIKQIRLQMNFFPSLSEIKKRYIDIRIQSKVLVSFLGWQVVGCDFELCQRGLDWIWGQTSSQREQSSIGVGCPGAVSPSLEVCKGYVNHNTKGHGVEMRLGRSGRWLDLKILKLFSYPNDCVILCIYACPKKQMITTLFFFFFFFKWKHMFWLKTWLRWSKSVEKSDELNDCLLGFLFPRVNVAWGLALDIPDNWEYEKGNTL